MTINFGKYKGKTIEEVFRESFRYFFWATINVRSFGMIVAYKYPYLHYLIINTKRLINYEERCWAEMLPTRKLSLKQWIDESFKSFSTAQKNNVKHEIALIKSTPHHTGGTTTAQLRG